MKCIKEKCELSYISTGCGFCKELGTFVFGDEPECVLDNKIAQMEKDLNKYKCLMDKIIIYHERNRE